MMTFKKINQKAADHELQRRFVLIVIRTLRREIFLLSSGFRFGRQLFEAKVTVKPNGWIYKRTYPQLLAIIL